MNEDLISRSALLKEIKRIGGQPYSDWETAGVLALAERIPAADAEKVFEAAGLVKEAFEMAKSSLVSVVRCKDCKHYCPYEGEEHKGDCDELVGLESCVYEDDFCSYGKRRADK